MSKTGYPVKGTGSLGTRTDNWHQESVPLRVQRRLAKKQPIPKPHPDQWLEDKLKAHWDRFMILIKKVLLVITKPNRQ